MLQNNLVRSLLLFSVVFASGCASKPVVLPMTVQSDPLGAYVLLRQQNTQTTEPEWVYLGNTPLTSQHGINGDENLVLRVMKEGFFDQTREWLPDQFAAELDNKKRVFWNPRLVPSASK